MDIKEILKEFKRKGNTVRLKHGSLSGPKSIKLGFWGSFINVLDWKIRKYAEELKGKNLLYNKKLRNTKKEQDELYKIVKVARRLEREGIGNYIEYEGKPWLWGEKSMMDAMKLVNIELNGGAVEWEARKIQARYKGHFGMRERDMDNLQVEINHRRRKKHHEKYGLYRRPYGSININHGRSLYTKDPAKRWIRKPLIDNVPWWRHKQIYKDLHPEQFRKRQRPQTRAEYELASWIIDEDHSRNIRRREQEYRKAVEERNIMKEWRENNPGKWRIVDSYNGLTVYEDLEADEDGFYRQWEEKNDDNFIYIRDEWRN